MRKSILGLAVIIGVSPLFAAECFNHSVWDNILKANVQNDGFIDYAAVRRNKGGTLYEYLTFLELADISGCSPDEKKAFWINAYNANVFRVVVEHPDLVKANEENGIYKRHFDVANERLSIKKIEDRIFFGRKEKGGPIPGLSLTEPDPRVHFVLVNGSLGAPKLKASAFFGETVNDSLQTAASDFVNDPAEIRIENDRLVMPAFLKWREADFEKVGGLVEYLKSLTDSTRRADADEIDRRLDSDYPDNVQFEYDWTINDIKNRP